MSPLKGKLCGWDVSDRSRIEYRDMENREGHVAIQKQNRGEISD